MSLLAQKNYKNGKNKSQRSKSQNRKNEKLSAIEELKRLYHKYNLYPTTSLLNQLNSKYIKIFFNEFSVRDITVLSQILSEFYFLQSIQISPHDPEKPEEITSKRKYLPAFVLQKENKRKLKERKMKQVKYKTMFNKIIYALAKQISKSKQIISLLLNKLEFNEKYSQILSKSISDNNSLQNFGITNSKLDLNSYEILLESFLNQNVLSFLDLSNNDFGDKYGYMISRIISRHSQRRDQVIWFYSLRNELPPSNEYKKGLMFINLNGNNLSKDSAECISSVLYSDQYIRAIYLNNNKFDNSSCKKFIYMMRKNLTILTIDLRENPGYDEDIHHRLVLKMSKNIRYLFQQYKMKEYTKDEFEQLKEFIDISFFDVNIPQDIVEFYNNNIPTTINTDDEKEEGYDLSEEYKKNIKTEFEGNQINKIKNKILGNDEDIDKIKNNKYNNTNYMDINSNILEENKKLYAENIKLKKQIIELKAKKLNLGKDLNNNIESKENKIIKTESVLEDDYNKVELLINELNELMNKIEEKTAIIENNKKLNVNKELKDSKEKQQIDQNEKDEGHKNLNKEKKNKDNINDKKNIKDITENNNIKEEEKNYNEEKDNNILNNNKNQKLNEEKKKENNNKDEESSDDSHFVDEEGNIHNIDDLTDEEKMVILQQRLILQKLQEEAEARGEQFDPQEYIEYLERQVREEEEEEN
jgi:hypothetical protein